jgi:hypothetical protein
MNDNLNPKRKYFLKGLLFGIPFMLYAVFIIVIDPYEFINVSGIISDKEKIAVLNRSDESGPRGNIFWKVIHFGRKPVKNVILGDSQGRKLDENLISELSGEPYFNFCVPGSSYETLFEIFWFAAGKTRLENVYMQVAFMNYNASRKYSLYHFAGNYIEKPYLYFITKEILYDSFSNLHYAITKNPELVENSYEYQSIETLDELAEDRLELFFGNYVYPQSYFDELVKIKEYCQVNGINLNFIIVQTYFKVDEYLEENQLAGMKQRFTDDIYSLGKTYDFNLEGEERKIRENFIDYYHPRQPLLTDITKRIWGKQTDSSD